jgi:hypothetical protein
MASDPDGDAITYELISELGTGMSFSDSGLLTWAPSASDVGYHEFLVSASDGQLSAVQSWSVRVWEDLPPLRLFLDVYPAEALPGSTVTITVNTSGGSVTPVLNVLLDDATILLDEFGQAEVTASDFGLHNIQATANSGTENADESATYLVLNAADATPPLVAINSPDNDAVVTSLATILGTINDDNLVAYDVYVSPKEPQLAKRLETGLLKLNETGEITEILLKYYKEDINRADIPNRRLITINNPFITGENKFNNHRFWTTE